MNKLPDSMLELLFDPDGKRAEDCIAAVVRQLEDAGLKERAIGRALGRVLLGFCSELGSKPENFGWAHDVLCTVGDGLERQAANARRRWVKRFMKKTGRLYRLASPCLDLELPAVAEAIEGRLRSLDTQGQA